MTREDPAVVYLMKYQDAAFGVSILYKIGVAEKTKLEGRVKDLQRSINQSKFEYRIELIDHVTHPNKPEAEKIEYLFHGYSECRAWLHDPEASRQFEGYNEMFDETILSKWRHYKETGQIDLVGIEPKKLVKFCVKKNGHTRWPEAESEIIKDTEAAVSYANSVIHGEWPELEKILLKDSIWTWYKSNSIHQFYLNARKERWLELEKMISEWIVGDAGGKKPRDSYFVVSYCTTIRNERWEEIEDWLLDVDDIKWTVIYWNKLGDRRWPELEEKILSELRDPEIRRPDPRIHQHPWDSYAWNKERMESPVFINRKIDYLLIQANVYAEKFREGDWPEIPASFQEYLSRLDNLG